MPRMMFIKIRVYRSVSSKKLLLFLKKMILGILIINYKMYSLINNDIRGLLRVTDQATFHKQ